MRVALKIAYDGTKFHGFQRQPNVRTIEGEILRALKDAGIEFENFKSASRTDRGVSARGNVIALSTEDDRIKNPMVLNSRMSDVWIWGIAEVPEDFHPRFWANTKVYRYYLPSLGMNIKKMKECSLLFLGTHDFSAFSRVDGRDTIRSIDRIEIWEKCNVVVVEIEGKSFLWEMVRRIVSALVLCSQGVLAEERIVEMLNGKFEKSRKVPPAPPEGLLLWDIKYENVEFQIDNASLKKFQREIVERFKLHASLSALYEDLILNEQKI
ncbi:tRNA pseudouridine(38-40) synthase TruA [Pyrococcus furiosus DSM 3638]|uniref:tRNA pseudouridine synthase A n=3 Tax=Pyrococcus furiosus TaxID=2261 RepID=TRUA_PYRFU|nr:tRNA pseudouridine(38-40) synthase TruA [Pyrococcus furiosus]Q8U2C1.1 RecName: Full=tRNA pseudouridine synthase A; AltName: Full=tRNA pseudouridine(38-40) synthase; AltName: Full=tRNA pseudouridylate synthase I; AltName: Full=tRNA-uridine isomerase I [Pyrococcus furiosus DSM 3638]AAL81042.1 putative tRNA pseudouridine synthase a [Pyrococcus furiosus DSM 3638]AFN03711.1 tRNA pseudouridine synthase A [Pyrococcus furiosus COM1]QEK78584.1 tRNA pseudouridine(38-40) synthase TruA [Pyrococcus furio